MAEDQYSLSFTKNNLSLAVQKVSEPDAKIECIWCSSFTGNSHNLTLSEN
jgi:hypothetical protein